MKLHRVAFPLTFLLGATWVQPRVESVESMECMELNLPKPTKLPYWVERMEHLDRMESNRKYSGTESGGSNPPPAAKKKAPHRSFFAILVCEGLKPSRLPRIFLKALIFKHSPVKIFG